MKMKFKRKGFDVYAILIILMTKFGGISMSVNENWFGKNTYISENAKHWDLLGLEEDYGDEGYQFIHRAFGSNKEDKQIPADLKNGKILKKLPAEFISNKRTENGEIFKFLHLERKPNGSHLIIGGRNALHNITLNEAGEIVKKDALIWTSTGPDRDLCLVKGKTESDCQNYIRVFAYDTTALHKRRILVCGTNSFNPKCRYYFKLESDEGDWKFESQFSGKGFCPFDPTFNSSFVYAGGELYAGTAADFAQSDSLIIRGALRTEQFEVRHLNSPSFVAVAEDAEHVYFFFREVAVEAKGCDTFIHSRIARVCKNDRGGPHSFQKDWTTFVKARLNCSVPFKQTLKNEKEGQHFYFNEIQAISVNPKDPDEIWAVFSTPENSISGDAICKFSLRQDVSSVFETSPFLQHSNDNGQFEDSLWFTEEPSENNNEGLISKEERPGSCKIPATDAIANFVKRNSLLKESVGRNPVFIRANIGERASSLDVFSDSMLLASNSGVVYRLKSKGDKVENGQRPIFEQVESFKVSDSEIRTVKLFRDFFISITDNQVLLVKFNQCQQFPNCQNCTEIPNCEWNPKKFECQIFEQSGKPRYTCPTPTTTTTTTTTTTMTTTTTQKSTTTTKKSQPFYVIQEPPSCPECECPICPKSLARNISTFCPSTTTEKIIPPSTSTTTTEKNIPTTPTEKSENDTEKNKVPEFLLDFLNTESKEVENNYIGRGIAFSEKVLPKRELAKDSIYDRLNDPVEPKTSTSVSLDEYNSFSENTLILASLLSGFFSLLIGFAFGLLVARLCGGGRLNNPMKPKKAVETSSSAEKEGHSDLEIPRSVRPMMATSPASNNAASSTHQRLQSSTSLGFSSATNIKSEMQLCHSSLNPAINFGGDEGEDSNGFASLPPLPSTFKPLVLSTPPVSNNRDRVISYTTAMSARDGNNNTSSNYLPNGGGGGGGGPNLKSALRKSFSNSNSSSNPSSRSESTSSTQTASITMPEKIKKIYL